MRVIQLFLGGALLLSVGFQHIAHAEPVICDPLQTIAIDMTIDIDEEVLADLQEIGVQELTLTPVTDFSWEKTFPLANGTIVHLCNNADPLGLDLDDGLLVTYKTCDGNMVYAYCDTNEDLKGEYPKEARLHLTPALGQCNIEVLCTQCP